MKYRGELLRINLTDKNIIREKLKADIFFNYLWGRGYASKLLLDEMNPAVDPLSPENKLIFALGPFAGTPLPATSRMMVVTKGALNGLIASSNVGGYFPFELQHAGYTLIVIEGKTDNPVYIWINDETVEIRDASHLWGKTTSEVDALLKDETHPEAKTVEIGPAGEKLSRIAAIIIDAHRAAGRTGVGAVMGSKNLKAIAVRGTRGVSVISSQRLKDYLTKIYERVKKSGGVTMFRTYGTTRTVRAINSIGAFPTHNHRDGFFDEYLLIDGENVNKEILVRNGSCAGCPIACNRISKVYWNGEEYVGGGPEYETLWAFGGQTGISDLHAVTYAHFLANEYGFDGISLGSTIAALMDLFESGIIGEDNLPFPVKFGDAEAMINLIHLAAKREGIGDLIAEGSYELTKHFGHPKFSMSVKKQELPAYDPRGVKGMGLAYATSNRGGCHVRAFTVTEEVYNTDDPEYRLKYDDKALIVKELQDKQAVVDSLGICSFARTIYGVDDFSEMLEVTWDIDLSPEELLKCGERIWNVERLFNVRAGFTREHDTLPERLFKEAIKTGPSKGEIYDKREFEKLLFEYYRLRGWDENGVPREKKLKELGII